MLQRGLATAAILAALTAPATADLRREVESNDVASNAQPTIPPASLGGTIGAPGDVDLYAFAVEAGQIIKADILARGFRAGASPGSELSALLTILDKDGQTVLAQDQSIGDFDDPTAQAQVTSSGRYFVEVRNLSPSEGGAGYTYVLSVELEPNDGFETATPLAPPVLPSIDSLIFPAGDHDYYTFEGRAGQLLTADIDSAAFNPAQPPAKIVLTVYDPARNRLAEDAYTSADPQDPFIQVVLPADGAYTIRVRELRSFVGTNNTFYQLTVELGPAADNDSFATGLPIVLPRAVSGIVNPGTDLDHFRFSLPTGSSLLADLDAREGLLSLLQGTLTLHDGTGVIAQDASAPDPLLTQGLGSGEYSVSVSGPCTGSGCVNEDSYYVMFLDGDSDGDGLRLPFENCPWISNPDQSDIDLDGVGDVCDNCRTVFNPDQRDSDGDGHGNACPPCDPPPEVALDLALTDAATLSWSPSPAASSYALYRGSIDGGAWAFDHSCREPALPGPGATDASAPSLGTAFYYLVSGRNACGEGTLGTTSADDPRPNAAPCP